MNEQEKYAIYKQVQETGGPCNLCGWRDGDGVRTCFYSEEVGIVRHQNSPKSIEASMTESQRRLLRSYNSLHDEFEHTHDPSQCLAALDYKDRVLPGQFRVAHACGGQFIQQFNDVSAWVCNGCGETTKESQGKMFFSHHHIEGDHRTCVKTGEYYKFAHLCGGTGEFAEAYHIYCTGCKEEVKLWEHGVDYDVG